MGTGQEHSVKDGPMFAGVPGGYATSLYGDDVNPANEQTTRERRRLVSDHSWAGRNDRRSVLADTDSGDCVGPSVM